MSKRKKKASRKSSQENAQKSSYQVLLLSGLLIVMTVISYAPTFVAGYVELDDQIYIRDNIHVNTGVTWENFLWAFTEVGFASNWHPLTWLSHMLDAQFFGVQPAGHHIVNVLIHSVNAVLLFLMLRSLTSHIFASFFVAALFALHPLNVESVAWLAQRKNTLSTFFGILAIWTYGHFAQRSSWRDYTASLVFFALSLLAKPMLVTLPFALLLLDYWPLRRKELFPERSSGTVQPAVASKDDIRGWLKLIYEKLPYLGLSVGASLVTLLAQSTAINPLERYPLSERLANVSVAYVEYLRLMVWPSKLAVFYPLYAEDNSFLQMWGAIALLASITAITLWLRKGKPYLMVGWLWYLGTMVPVIGIVQVGAQAYADRYTYVPFWGLWIAIVWLAKDLLQSFGTASGHVRGVAAAAIIIFGTLGWLTFRQSEKWYSNVTLFESAIENTDKNWLAHHNLARHYLLLEDYEKSIWHSRQPLTWGREYPMMYSTLGRALFEMGHREEGLLKLQQSIDLFPDSALSRANLGWAYVSMGEFQNASEQLEAGYRLLADEDNVYARRIINANWGIALTQLGKPAEGLEKFELALAREPDNVDLLREAARIDFQLKEYERGRQRLVRILMTSGLNVPALEMIAQSFVDEENWKEAVSVYQSLIEAVPEHFDARMRLSDVLIKQDQFDAARQQLQSLASELSDFDLSEVKSFLVQVYSKIAITYASIEDRANAEKSASQALELAEEIQDQEMIDQVSQQLEQYKIP